MSIGEAIAAATRDSTAAWDFEAKQGLIKQTLRVYFRAYFKMHKLETNCS